MDSDELARLREKYQTETGGVIHDPKFARVAATQFKGEGSVTTTGVSLGEPTDHIRNVKS